MATLVRERVEALAPTDLVEVTLSLDTNAYASGDVLAATQEVAGVFTHSRRVRLESLVVLDKDDQGQGLDVVFLRSNAALGTENAAFSPSDSVAEAILGVVVVASGDFYDLTNSQIAFKSAAAGDAGMGMLLEPSSGTSLYVGAISRGTGTYTASGVVLKLGLVGS